MSSQQQTHTSHLTPCDGEDGVERRQADAEVDILQNIITDLRSAAAAAAMSTLRPAEATQ